MTTDSPFSRRQGLVHSAFWPWVALIAFSVLLRIYNPYCFDDNEHMHINIASAPALSDVVRYSLYETHPPLFYILLHGWMQISDSPFFIRCFALVFGLSLLPVYYLIGRQLGGKPCAVACLTLAALSPSLIHQAQLMRHYGVFLLCISLGFYSYLRWRDSLKYRFLIAYFLFGCLAALAHFTALLFLASMAAIGSWQLRAQRASLGKHALWLAVNLLPILMGLELYAIWQPAIHRYAVFFAQFTPPSFPLSSLILPLWAPFAAAFYIYPYLPIIAGLLIYAALSTPKPERLIMVMAAIPCLLCTLLYLTHLYTPLGTRHNLWMTPFLIAASGWAAVRVFDTISWQMSRGSIALCLLAIMLYEASQAYTSERGDYAWWGLGIWQDAQKVMDGLGPDDLIITDVSGINIALNPYPTMSDEAFLASGLPQAVPYRRSRMLLLPEIVGMRKEMEWDRTSFASLLPNLEQGEKAGQFAGTKRIVFLKTWDPLFYQLLACKALEKEVLYSQEREVRPKSFAVVAIRSDVFERDVLSSAGKARACFK